ncbi:non-ribosomal peptide synthetase [Corallococcus llansteffanensis]|uniref:Amino acid adenylation domain-containing protein n=1 Tax=Corallococcus llansteffanensis TaxID=2316731 RepID=A0A3A8NYD6_9BACT|nr:amino acid adenylation domain-containing protein [Corallococcus llansteffanensis]RKH49357.1 amino acid adenylation domain-containing protein [Corallococcus llansteffanensis]
MTLQALLTELTQRRISVTASGNTLRLRGPASALTDDVRGRVATHKQELLAWLEQTRSAPSRSELARMPKGAELPVSSFQRRMWFIDRLRPGLTAYNLAIELRFRGRLDLDALRWCIQELVRRHDVLRSTFETVDGRPCVRVAPVLGLPLPIVDLTRLPQAEREHEARRLARVEASTPFSLVHGPLLRLGFLRLSDEDLVGLFTFHHIISDGWSLTVLARELRALYTARTSGQPSPLPELAFQYADFAHWHTAWLSEPVLEAHLAYWRRQLDGCPRVLQLPADARRPSQQSHRGATLVHSLSPELTAAVKAASQREGGRLFPFLLTVFQTLLGRHTGQDEFLVGTSVANRDRAEVAGMVGFFVNWLPLRANLRDDPPFSEALARTRATVHDALVHKDLPFELLVNAVNPERELDRPTLFQVMFVLHGSMPELSLPGIEVEGRTVDNGTAKMDLTLFMRDTPRGLECEFEYSADLFERSTIERLARHFITLCRAATEDPSCPVSRLPMLAREEQDALSSGTWSAGHVSPPPPCVHQLFEAQARRTPHAVALWYEGVTLTYAELDQRANQLARHLVGLGLQPGSRVGVLVERSLELLVALLGVWKAGCAYVPLDASYPVVRIAFMARDARLGALLVHGDVDCAAEAVSAPVVDLEALRDVLAALPSHPVPLEVEGEQPAYVLYTSGSTGRPKGVLVPHWGVANFLLWLREELALGASDRVLHKTPISFDASLRELFSALISGGRLVIARPDGHRDPAYLIRLMREQGVTVLHLVPSLLGALLEQPELSTVETLRAVMSGGEALPVSFLERVRDVLPDAALFNVYGPTETSVDSTCWRAVPLEGQASVPVGRPIWNTEIHLLDPHLQPCPPGMVGEICIGGRGVALGYLDLPELTRERFIANPYGPGRLYRTGDLGRFLPGGDLEFRGRADRQVKVRGMRVELAEVERAARDALGSADVVVVAREDRPGDVRLVAYVVMTPEEAREKLQEARAALREKLPEAMVPTAFVLLEAWPLLPNGKRDPGSLPAPAEGADTRDLDEAPVTLPVRDVSVERLRNATPLALPTDRPRLPGLPLTSASFTVDLAAEQRVQLERLARARGFTPFEALLSVTLGFLARQAAQARFVVTLALSGRDDVRLSDALGSFVRMVPVPVALPSDTSLAGGLAVARAVLVAASEPDAASVDELTEAEPALDGGDALHRFAIVWRDTPRLVSSRSNLTVHPALPMTAGESRYELRLSLGEVGEGLRATFEYRVALFDAATVARLAHAWTGAMGQALAALDAPWDLSAGGSHVARQDG